MAEEVRRGDIWMLERRAPDKRRPVLVLSRPSLIQVLHTVTVVAITSTRRGTPIEVPLGVEEGLKHPSCANLANLFTVHRSDLRRYVGSASDVTMRAVCRRSCSLLAATAEGAQRPCIAVTPVTRVHEAPKGSPSPPPSHE